MRPADDATTNCCTCCCSCCRLAASGGAIVFGLLLLLLLVSTVLVLLPPLACTGDCAGDCVIVGDCRLLLLLLLPLLLLGVDGGVRLAGLVRAQGTQSMEQCSRRFVMWSIRYSLIHFTFLCLTGGLTTAPPSAPPTLPLGESSSACC